MVLVTSECRDSHHKLCFSPQDVQTPNPKKKNGLGHVAFLWLLPISFLLKLLFIQLPDHSQVHTAWSTSLRQKNVHITWIRGCLNHWFHLAQKRSRTPASVTHLPRWLNALKNNYGRYKATALYKPGKGSSRKSSKRIQSKRSYSVVYLLCSPRLGRRKTFLELTRRINQLVVWDCACLTRCSFHRSGKFENLT